MAPDPTTTDWINAGASAGLLVTAVIAFGVTIVTLIAGRNRQRLEIEGYVRVDIGPPAGTQDYQPPAEIAYVESTYLETVGRTTKQSPVISVWYRNLQQHPLGVALGIASRVTIALVDRADNLHEIAQTHEIAYLEPGKTVRVDCVRFPSTWDCVCQLGAIQYRNLHWDGSLPRHGRQECWYIDGEFEMVPVSDPTTIWRDRWAAVTSLPWTLKRLIHRDATSPDD